MRPDRWAPVWTNLGDRDRGASLRVCPIFDALEGAARQFHVEFRVCDATASPYMALGAMVHAGIDGIRNGMTLGTPPSRSFWDMTDEERRALGLAPLPGSLEEALDLLQADPVICRCLGSELLDVYLRLKRSEIEAVRGRSDEEICSRYAAVY